MNRDRDTELGEITNGRYAMRVEIGDSGSCWLSLGRQLVGGH